MSTLLEITSVVRDKLNDTDSMNYRWSESEMLADCNSGLREIVRIKPDANMTVASVALSAGVEQDIPENGILMLDVMRNMGTDGSTPGNSVVLASLDLFNKTYPDWAAADQQTEINNWLYDSSMPKLWYCSPPSDGAGYVKIAYSEMPSALGDLIATFPLGDEYFDAMVHYLIYRALLKDSDYAASFERAQRELAVMYQSLGRHDLMEMAFKFSTAKMNQGG